MQEHLSYLKKCCKCGIEKPIDEFYVADKKTGRKRTDCKECLGNRIKKYYRENEDVIKDRASAYYQENKEKINQYRSQWSRENAEKQQSYRDKWLGKNPDYKKAVSQRSRLGDEEYSRRKKDERQRNINTYRNNEYKNKFGITIDEYNDMYIEQGGSCAICGIHQSKLERRLAVDHCHTTGDVRGLLCSNCNTGIGMLQDDTSILMNAIKYLSS